MKPFLGEIKNPSDFNEKYNPRRDNKVPDESISSGGESDPQNHECGTEERSACVG